MRVLSHSQRRRVQTIGGNMASQTMIESERNKQLRRIADALEKIARCMNKRTLDNIVLSNDKLTFEYGSKDDEK